MPPSIPTRISRLPALMAEGRVGAIAQQSIEAIVLLDSDETKLDFQALLLCNSIRLRFCLREMQRLPIQVTLSDLGAQRLTLLKIRATRNSIITKHVVWNQSICQRFSRAKYLLFHLGNQRVSLSSSSVNSKQKSAVSAMVSGKTQTVYRTIFRINSLPLSPAS